MLNSSHNNNYFQIAIDGPVAAGKGTIAKLLSQQLGYLYVDTGAMYRTAAVIAIRAQADLSDEVQIAKLVAEADIKMYDQRNLETGEISSVIELNNEDISQLIRTHEVDLLVPKVAAMPTVRQVLVKKQQEIAAKNNVVMEGRDISYRVLPFAQMKIFLTASASERARRRHEQYLLRGNHEISREEVLSELLKRDEMDSNRSTDPLRQVPEAWLIDTTQIDIDQVVQQIIKRMEQIRCQVCILDKN